MDDISKDDVLKTEIRSLYALHLGMAFDEMREAKDLSDDTSNSDNRYKARRLSLSSILHAFCSLEALLNYLGYRRFFYSEATEYIKPEKRDFLLNRLLKSWEKLRVNEKTSALVWSYSSETLSPNIEGRLIELNNLRNWIAHGKTYHTISLIEQHPDEPYAYYIVDEENSVDWSKKFPRCKFKEPHTLDQEDAQIALRLVIELFLVLSKSTKQNFFYTTLYPIAQPCGLYGELTVNIDNYIKKPKTEPFAVVDSQGGAASAD